MLRADAAAKNDWVLKAYDRFPVDVLNLSSQDLAYLSPRLRKERLINRGGAYAVLDRLVSSNLIPDTATAAPRPFLIKEVTERGTSKKIRIGFTGALEAGAAVPGLRSTEPFPALSKAVSELRRKADVVIAAVHLSTDDAIRVAREVKGIDVVIAGNSEMFTPPVRLGQTLLVFTPSEGRMLGEIRFYREA